MAGIPLFAGEPQQRTDGSPSSYPGQVVDFDSPSSLEFQTCNQAYRINSVSRSSVIDIQRIVLDNVPLCEALAGV